MKKLLLLSLLCWVAPVLAADKTALKAELVRAENEFCRQAAVIGIPEAFVANMAEQSFNPGAGSLTRAEYAAGANAGSKSDKLTWLPLMVDVSGDGTLGYTWGKYEFTGTGSDGQPRTGSGIYLSIWKRQADGSWKFVYDGAPQMPPEAVKKFLARPDLPDLAKN